MRKLNMLIKDEKKAPKDYHALLIKLPNKEKPIIQRIIKDEQNHLIDLKRLKRRLNK